jgi:hypothetical protein
VRRLERQHRVAIHVLDCAFVQNDRQGYVRRIGPDPIWWTPTSASILEAGGVRWNGDSAGISAGSSNSKRSG